MRISPDAPALLHRMTDVLEHQLYLKGPELAASLEPRLDQLVASVAPSAAPIRRKLFAMRGWLHVLRRPDAARRHGGIAYIRSFLLADCAALECLLAGPPDPDPGEVAHGGLYFERSSWSRAGQ
jgi:hypothetical protein